MSRMTVLSAPRQMNVMTNMRNKQTISYQHKRSSYIQDRSSYTKHAMNVPRPNNAKMSMIAPKKNVPHKYINNSTPNLLPYKKQQKQKMMQLYANQFQATHNSTSYSPLPVGASPIIPNKILNPRQTIGFIMTRHVNSKETDQYWKLSYSHIRRHYPHNKIVIIDDDSNPLYLDKSSERNLYNTVVINSEYPRRGELLPYIYFIKNKWFDTAVIIHDSVFINKLIDFRVKNYKMIGDAHHMYDHPKDEIRMLNGLDNNAELLNLHSQKHLWRVCYGALSIITHDFLSKLHNRYNLYKLIPYVKTRYNRISFERIIACMMNLNDTHATLVGELDRYIPYGTKLKDIERYRDKLFIKVWRGR